MTTLPTDIEALLVEQIRNRKRMWRVGAITMIVVMIVLAGVAWLGLSPHESRGIIRMAGLGALVGALLFIPSFGDPTKARILTTLRERASSIVWLYVHRQRGQSAASWIVVGFDDGKQDRVDADVGREEAVLTALAGLAPRATLGFSPEIEARFRQAPASLRR